MRGQAVWAVGDRGDVGGREQNAPLALSEKSTHAEKGRDSSAVETAPVIGKNSWPATAFLCSSAWVIRVARIRALPLPLPPPARRHSQWDLGVYSALANGCQASPLVIVLCKRPSQQCATSARLYPSSSSLASQSSPSYAHFGITLPQTGTTCHVLLRMSS